MYAIYLLYYNKDMIDRNIITNITLIIPEYFISFDLFHNKKSIFLRHLIDQVVLSFKNRNQ